MECPKCGGGAYLAEEEFVKILENTDPLKVIAKAIYQCRACSERFTRLNFQDIEARKKEESAPTQEAGVSEEAEEGLRFF